MSTYSVKAYGKVAVESSVATADPHQLVLMLFDGALDAIRQAQSHMVAGRIAEKGAALGKALRIVEEGLKASLDGAAGGELAARLRSLYDYSVMKLLQGNLRNDGEALRNVAKLLGELRDAWSQIRTPTAVAAARAVHGEAALRAFTTAA